MEIDSSMGGTCKSDPWTEEVQYMMKHAKIMDGMQAVRQ